MTNLKYSTLADIERHYGVPMGTFTYSGDEIVSLETGELIGTINKAGEFEPVDSQVDSPTVDADALEAQLTSQQIEERAKAELQLAQFSDFPEYNRLPYKHGHGGYDRHEDPNTQRYAVRSEFLRRFGRYPQDSSHDIDLMAKLEAEVKADRELPTLDLEPADFEFQPSGSAPELPFPAARISTISGTINLNASTINRLRDQFEGLPPAYVGLALHPTRPIIMLTFSNTLEYGYHRISTATEFNRGWTIHCKGMISRLTYRVSRAKDLHSDPYGKTNIEQAADLVFGRRRLSKLNASSSWAINLDDQIV